MSIAVIEEYFKSNVYKPFYLSVGDVEYKCILEKLLEAGDVECIYLSKYCREKDKRPDLDKLKETLRMADVDCQSNKLVVLGLGEYLALEGTNKATNILNELVSFNLGSAHAVFLLRGLTHIVRNMTQGDPRLAGRQICIDDNSGCSISFMFSSLELGMYSDTGISMAIAMAEAGTSDKISVNTALDFPNSILQIQKVQNPYEAICKIDRDFALSKKYGNDDEWADLLVEVTNKRSVKSVIQDKGYDETLSDFYQRISGNGYESWLYYLYLITYYPKKNVYLEYAQSKSENFESFKDAILNAISLIPHNDARFVDYYLARKKIVAQYPDSDIAVFVSNNRFDAEESVYKLTDNTIVEKEEIIAQIAQHGVPRNLSDIYPDLALYLQKYHFNGDSLSELLTEYFEEYKRQKISNQLEPEFLEKVDELAQKREYNRLRTRDELVAGIQTEGSFLCWVDALGVEYLSFIVNLAQQKGLAVSVNVGRAELPTITSINKHFYDVWPEETKRKIEDLDDIKHTEKGGYKYGASNQYPIHLAKELKILADVINEAATDLGLHRYERYVIASDHGASRLAVLRKKEEKYDTDTQGEHSGRCCKFFSGYDLPFATEENGYLVLADYGRFKKSRAANVEVHGGASLEEVLVPVVSLSLRDASIEIKVVETVIKADYKTGTTLTLFVNKNISHTIYVDYKGKRYPGVAIDANHYKVDIADIKRACMVEAEIYLGEDLVSHISVKAVGKSASMNSDFDDLL